MTSSVIAEPPVLGVQTPRLRSVPEYASSSGDEAIELAALAGLNLDPWEQLVLREGLGERADGKWAAFEVGLAVSRQNGKGSVLEARELAGVFLFGERLIIHSAHEQATSSEHFRRILMLLESTPEFDQRVMKVVRGKGSEAIELRGGYRIFFKTRTGGGGRGLTGDLVVLDEAMILPAAMMAALVPTMAARSIEGNPQLWYAGSAVDQQKHEHGLTFSRLRNRGIEGSPRVAWMEWSVEGDDPDDVPEEVRTDPAAWAMANPGMGIRISAEHIANECGGALGKREFAVERLGIGDWPSPDDENPEIATATWRALTDPESSVIDPVCFSVDVTPSQRAAAISVAGRRADGDWHVEVLEHRSGTDWAPGRLYELTQKHASVPVPVDDRGPAGALIPNLEQLGVTVDKISAGQHASACGAFVDIVNQGAIRHRGQQVLEAAVRGAGKRPLGDAWAWSRRASDVDISPLVSTTLALWGAIKANIGAGGGGFEW